MEDAMAHILSCARSVASSIIGMLQINPLEDIMLQAQQLVHLKAAMSDLNKTTPEPEIKPKKAKQPRFPGTETPIPTDASSFLARPIMSVYRNLEFARIIIKYLKYCQTAGFQEIYAKIVNTVTLTAKEQSKCKAFGQMYKRQIYTILHVMVKLGFLRQENKKLYTTEATKLLEAI